MSFSPPPTDENAGKPDRSKGYTHPQDCMCHDCLPGSHLEREENKPSSPPASEAGAQTPETKINGQCGTCGKVLPECRCHVQSLDEMQAAAKAHANKVIAAMNDQVRPPTKQETADYLAHEKADLLSANEYLELRLATATRELGEVNRQKQRAEEIVCAVIDATPFVKGKDIAGSIRALVSDLAEARRQEEEMRKALKGIGQTLNLWKPRASKDALAYINHLSAFVRLATPSPQGNKQGEGT